MSWTDLSVPLSGTPPDNRSLHGFASAGGGLYVHGGLGLQLGYLGGADCYLNWLPKCRIIVDLESW